MRQCAICGKSYLMGGTRRLLRGHYNPTNTTKKQPNLQWARIPGKPGRVKACIKCGRKLKASAKGHSTLRVSDSMSGSSSGGKK